MVKVALLSLEQNIVDYVSAIKKKLRLNIMLKEVVAPRDALSAAINAEDKGADIILSYGLQTLVETEELHIPVVNIKLTGQDVGMLISKAKEGVTNRQPRIALLIYSCMFRSATQMGELLGVNLKIGILDGFKDISGGIEKAIEDGAEIIVSGHEVCAEAKKRGVRTLEIFSGKEGVDMALRNAELLAHSIELSKRNTAESSAYMDSVFHGIIEIDKNGAVIRINDYARDFITETNQPVIGQTIYEFFPRQIKALLERVLATGEQVFSHSFKLKKREIILNVEPIISEKEVIGAVINLQKGQYTPEITAEKRKELYTRGLMANQRFENIVSTSLNYRNLLKQAKLAAYTNAPILIYGEEGTETLRLAQCIHNESGRSGNGFIEVECNAWEPEHLDEILFGAKHSPAGEKCEPGLVEMAEEGTIFFNHIDVLTKEIQYRVCKLIKGQLVLNSDKHLVFADVRVVAATDKDLRVLVNEGRFRSDLYYALCVLTLDIPPLRERQQDIEDWINRFLDYYSDMYSKPVRLSKGAYECLCAYSWPGNFIQLENFCQKIVLTTPHRNIEEAFIRSRIDDMNRQVRTEGGKEIVTVYKDKNAVRVTEALKRNSGIRTETAKELGISTTTLWRLMQKYGITADYMA